MKVKITQEGWAGFTGNFGGHEFVDGVSVDSMTPHDAMRIAACVSVEDVETGKNPSIAQVIIDSRNAAMSADQAQPDLTQLSQDGALHNAGVIAYTRAELEAIAEKGIQALRDVAEPFGVRSNSIVKLIEAMLQAGVHRPHVDPAPASGADEAMKV